MKRWWYREIVRGSRLALPPAWAMWAVGVVYLLLESLNRRFGAAWEFEPSEANVFQSFQSSFLFFAAAVFGVYRVIAYHPYLRASYRNWLMTTCWRVGQPLPLGPVTLTIADAVVLAVGMGFLRHANPFLSPLMLPCAFAAAYFVSLAVVLIREDPRGYGYAIVFGLGAMSLFTTRLPIVCAIAVPTYIVAWIGLRRSLARLPNFEPGWIGKAIAAATASRIERAQYQHASVGWPFGTLCPRRSQIELPRFDAVCISVLTGWILFGLITSTLQHADNRIKGEDDASFLCMAAIVACSAVAFVRLTIYCRRCRPSISFFGRLATGRWLIPSYDLACAAPAIGFLVLWWLGPWLLDRFGFPFAVKFPIAVTLLLLVALVPGPCLRDWILTSDCRIVPLKPNPQRD